MVGPKDDVLHVGDDDDTLILAFHLQERLGDQTFQHALVLLVAGIEGLVAEQQDAIAQMFIEATDPLCRVEDLHAVVAEGARTQ